MGGLIEGARQKISGRISSPLRLSGAGDSFDAKVAEIIVAEAARLKSYRSRCARRTGGAHLS